MTPIRLYPLHCTLYCCTHTPTLTRRQSSALVALSPAFVSDFCFNFRSVHSIGYNFHSTFCLRFRQKSKVSFQIQFSVGSKQRATTTLDFEHVFSLLSVFSLSFRTVNPVCSCIFCVCHIFVSSPNLALQWLPFFVLRGTSTQQTFGFCQPFLILKTCLVTI